MELGVQGIVLRPPHPHLFLQEVYLALHTTVVQVHPNMLSVCGGGHQEAWTFLRLLSRYTTYPTLPSWGRKRLRPRTMTPRIDIHTHQRTLNAGSIEVVCLDIADLQRQFRDDDDRVCKTVEAAGDYVSVGIHPWNATEATDACLILLQTVVERCSNVLLIGEVGFDKSRSVSIQRQEDVFRRQMALSEACHKPMVIHCVRAWDELLRLKKECQPKQPWIIHGYRGKMQQAAQLVRAGMEISLGERFNPTALNAIPLERLWIETDMAKTTISSVYSAIIQASDYSPEQLTESVFKRFTQLTEQLHPSLYNDSTI